MIDLIQKESDNNVKLIVLDRVDVLQSKHEHTLDALVLDILAVLSRLVSNLHAFIVAETLAAQTWKFAERHLTLP